MLNIKYIAVLLPVLIIVGLIYIASPKRNKTSNETITTIQTEDNRESVPLPSEKDIIRTFFNLINEKRIPEAISMMTAELSGDETSKQSWGTHFNAFQSVQVAEINSSLEEEWANDTHNFKVTLDVQMNPESASAPIPYYGWDNGTNIRWLTLTKIGNLWKIGSINTGP